MLAQGPKVVKTDAALTAFIPSALRKRNLAAASTTFTANKRSSLASSSSSSSSGSNSASGNVRVGDGIITANSTDASYLQKQQQHVNKAPSLVLSTAATTVSASVDDIYSSFMDEINELTGI